MLGSHATATAVSANFPSLIGAIGEASFGATLVAFLHGTCGAEHSTVFHLRQDELLEITAASIDGTDTAHRQVRLYLADQLWRRDPTLSRAQNQLVGGSTALIRTDIQHLADHDLRDVVYGGTNIRDRILLCARSQDGIVGLSVLRSAKTGYFTDSELQQMETLSESLFAVLAKHISLTWNSADLSVALTSLSEIESCIATEARDIPRREAEVCSRIIYGMSTLGVALELGISQETVMTYRKRAYQRLGIATQRELLLWYLASWSRWRGHSVRHVKGH